MWMFAHVMTLKITVCHVHKIKHLCGRACGRYGAWFSNTPPNLIMSFWDEKPLPCTCSVQWKSASSRHGIPISTPSADRKTDSWIPPTSLQWQHRTEQLKENDWENVTAKCNTTRFRREQRGSQRVYCDENVNVTMETSNQERLQETVGHAERKLQSNLWIQRREFLRNSGNVNVSRKNFNTS